MCQHLIAVRFDDDTILYSQSDSTCNINARLYRNDHIFGKYRIVLGIIVLLYGAVKLIFG